MQPKYCRHLSNFSPVVEAQKNMRFRIDPFQHPAKGRVKMARSSIIVNRFNSDKSYRPARQVSFAVPTAWIFLYQST
jgi:hypothetical protein